MPDVSSIAWNAGTIPTSFLAEAPIPNGARPTSNPVPSDDAAWQSLQESRNDTIGEAISAPSQQQQPGVGRADFEPVSPTRIHPAQVDIPRLNCASCERSFNQRGDLVRHMNTTHGNPGDFYLCPYSSCKRSQSDKGFPRKDNWRNHIRRHHPADASTAVVNEKSTVEKTGHPSRRQLSQQELQGSCSLQQFPLPMQCINMILYMIALRTHYVPVQSPARHKPEPPKPAQKRRRLQNTALNEQRFDRSTPVISDLDASENQREQVICLKLQLSEKDERINRLEAEIEDQNKTLKERNDRIECQDAELKSLRIALMENWKRNGGIS